MLYCFFQRKIPFACSVWTERHSDFNIPWNGKDSQLIKQIWDIVFRIFRLMVFCEFTENMY